MVGVTVQPIDSYMLMTPMTPMTPFLYRWNKYKIGENKRTRKTPAYMESAVTGDIGVTLFATNHFKSSTYKHDTYFRGVTPFFNQQTEG